MTDKRISASAIRKAWTAAANVTAAGMAVGLSRAQIQKRAARLGLPQRKPGRPRNNKEPRHD